MRGLRAACWVAFGAFVAVLSPASRAAACVADQSPPALSGIPAADAIDVPTNVVPVFSYFNAKIDETGLSLATFELVASGGETIALRALPTYAAHFELVSDVELAARVAYVLHATLVLGSGESAEASLAFTTGDAPLEGVPEPPPVRMQHFVAPEAPPPLCGWGRAGSCIFFGTQTVLDLTFTGPDLEPVRYLALGPVTSNLTGVDVTAGYDCVIARTRATDSMLSDSLALCRDNGERFDLSTTNGLSCTENGLAVDGMLLGGATEPDPDGPSTRTIVTEGCGCALPGRAHDGRFVLAFAVLAAFSARRRFRPSKP
jgi:hypothetical protein